MNVILDADKPFLSQLEELALSDDQTCEWLVREIYQNPRRLFLLESMRLETPCEMTEVDSSTIPKEE